MYMQVCLWEHMHINARAQRGQEEGTRFFAAGVTASYELLSSVGAGNWTLALHKNHTQACRQSRPHYKCSNRKKKKPRNIQVLLIRNLLFMKKIFKKYLSSFLRGCTKVKMHLWMLLWVLIDMREVTAMNRHGKDRLLPHTQTDSVPRTAID